MTAPVPSAHVDQHQVHHIGWLRAAVLGANDGIVSTASLIVGVAAASADRLPVLTAGVAGLVAGALSMAAGEYVSVSSQADTEAADLELEKRELARNPQGELEELAAIYRGKGVEPTLALEVARQMTAHDALGVHASAELGINEITAARPIQAALTSAFTFAVGAALPLLAAALAPMPIMVKVVSILSLVALAALGAIGAWRGGASMVKGAVRVTFWGVLAMAATYAIGWLFGTSVA